MKCFKRVLPMVLSLFMVFSIALMGCGDKESDKPADKTKAGEGTTTKVEEPAKLEPATVKLTIPGAKQKDYDKVAAEWNKILKEKINAELVFDILPWDGINEKIVAMFAANEDMDLVFTGSGYFQYYNNAINHAFLALDELVEKYGQDMKANINPLYLEGPKINGKLYMIPTNKEIADGKCMLFRKDIADKYGFDPSKLKGGLDELTPFLEQIKKNEKDITPLPGDVAFFGTTTGMMENLEKYAQVPNYGNCYINMETGKVCNAWELDFQIEKYKLYRDWFKKGFFNHDIQETKISQDDAIRTGKIWCWATMNKPGENKFQQINFGLDTELLMMTGLKPLISTTSTSGAGLAIRETSKNSERSMMVINLLWSDEKLIHLVQDGIEGTHYVKVNDTQKKLPDGIKKAEDTGYYPGFGWMFGDLFKTYVWDNEAPDKHEQFKAFNESGYKSPLLSFNFDAEPVKAEAAAIGSVETTYVPMLDKGQLDVDEALAELNKRIRDAGVEKVMAEIQKQYDAWKAVTGK